MLDSQVSLTIGGKKDGISGCKVAPLFFILLFCVNYDNGYINDNDDSHNDSNM